MMEESTASGQLASTTADFQTAAETYYSIAVEKVKDVRYVAGHVSITRLACMLDRQQRAVKRLQQLLLASLGAYLRLFTARISPAVCRGHAF